MEWIEKNYVQTNFKSTASFYFFVNANATKKREYTMTWEEMKLK